MMLLNYWLCPKGRKTTVANIVELEESLLIRSKMAINFTVFLCVRNYLKLTIQYRPPNTLESTKTCRQSRQVLSMQLKEVLIAVIKIRSVPFTKLSMLVPPHTAILVQTALINTLFTAPFCAIHGVGDARSATRCPVGTHRLG